MERVLKECTEELQQKDSILEPTTARTLERFVQVGGSLEDALDLMVGSFADLPTSLNKMMELLHLSGNRLMSSMCGSESVYVCGSESVYVCACVHMRMCACMCAFSICVLPYTYVLLVGDTSSGVT